MIALGLTCSPLEFCSALKDTKEKYSVNEVTRAKIAVFMTLDTFTKIRQRNIPRKVLIFDTVERLDIVTGLTILKQKTVNTLLPLVLSHEATTPELSLKNRDYVKEIIEKNKDDSTSFLHIYSTNLYDISFAPTRDAIRNLYLAFINGTIDRQKLEREMKQHYPKRGKSLLAVNNLMELLDTDLFKRMQKAIQKAQGKQTKEIEAVASKFEVAPFDLRYFLNTSK